MSQNDFNNDAQQGGASFGEYQSTTTTKTTTNMGGVDAQQGGVSSEGGAAFGEYQSTKPTFARASTKVTYNPNVIQAKTTVAPTKTLPTKFLPTINKDHLGQVQVDSSSSSNFDINAFTSTSDSGANFGGDFQATTTTTTTTETTTSGFDMAQFGGAEGGESAGFDASAFQSGEATVDTGATFGGDFQATTTTTTTTETTTGGFDMAQFGGAEGGESAGFDASAFQSGEATVDTGANFGGDFQATTTTTTTTETTTGGFDMAQFGGAEGGESAGFDASAFQSGEATVDTGANFGGDFQATTTTTTTTETTNFGGFDAQFAGGETSTTLQTDQTFDLNNLQSSGQEGAGFEFNAENTETPLVDATSALQDYGASSGFNEYQTTNTTTETTTTTTNFEGLQGFDLNNLQAGSSSDFSAFQTTTTTESNVEAGAASYDEGNANVDAIPSTTLEPAMDLGQFGGETTVQTTTTTTTTTTSDVDSGAATFGEYESTSALNSVPAVPTRTLDTYDEFQNGEGSSEATVTPLKGSFAISRNKYVGGMSAYGQAEASMEEGNAYNASTHSDLRGNIGSKGTASAGGFTSFSEYTVTKDFNTRTYNPQSQF